MNPPRLTWPPTAPDPASLPPWAWVAAAGSVVLLLAGAAVTAYLLGRRRVAVDATDQPNRQTQHRASRRTEGALTAAAAGIATAGAWTGMLNVFEHRLGITGIEAYVLAGFLEIAMVTCGIRARRHVQAKEPAALDRTCVWILATLSAVLASSAEHGAVGRAARLVLPLVAAGMWELFLRGDRPSDTKGIAWRWTPRLILVALGLADPEARDTTDVAKARRLAKLTRARARLATFERVAVPQWLALLTARPLRTAIASWRFQRLAYGAVEHLRLGTDPATLHDIQAVAHAVTTLRDATDPRRFTGPDPRSIGSGSGPIEAIGQRSGAAHTIETTGEAIGVDPIGHRIGAGSGPIGPIGSGMDRPDDRADRVTGIGHGSPTIGSGSGPSIGRSDRVTTIGAGRVEARPKDVDEVHSAIRNGSLTLPLSAEAIRRTCGISPNYARAARDYVNDELNSPYSEITQWLTSNSNPTTETTPTEQSRTTINEASNS